MEAECSTPKEVPMSGNAELDELHQLVGRLRRCATSLASGYSDAPAARRIVNDAERILNDIDRLDIDAEELQLTLGVSRHHRSGEKVPIPDTQYDSHFWRDVDDEGVGGQIGACARISRSRKRRWLAL
jgi:hypothetical protein